MSNNAPSVPVHLRKQRDFSEVFSAGFLFIRQNWKALARTILIYVLPLVILGFLIIGMEMYSALSGFGRIPSMGLIFLGYLILILGNVAGLVVVYEFMVLYDRNGDRPPTSGEMWKRVRSKFLSYFGLSLLQGLIFGIAYFLCVLLTGVMFQVHWSLGVLVGLPMIAYIITMFAYGLPCYAFDMRPGVDSIFRPFSLTQGRWWRSFFVLFLAALLVLCLMYAVMLPAIFLGAFSTFSGAGPDTFDPYASRNFAAIVIGITFLVATLMGTFLQPIIFVNLGVNVTSLMEEKEGVSLTKQVEGLDFGGAPAPEQRNG